MAKLKRLFVRFLSSGLHSGLGEAKKFALQIANFDILITILILIIYSIQSNIEGIYPLNYLHPIFLTIAVIGYILLRFQFYDTARILIHLNGLVAVFLTADSVSHASGYEFYYFVGITIPFVTFSLDEHWKGTGLSLLTATVFLLQEYLGPHLFMPVTTLPPNGRIEAVIIVVIYVISFFAVCRWQLARSQKTIASQHAELIHNSNLIALGELSSGIAHEINNPLQALNLQVEILKRDLRSQPGYSGTDSVQIDSINRIILKMSKMINGLKDLSRDVSQDSKEVFTINTPIEDVQNIASEKLKNLGISWKIAGDTSHMLYGHSVLMSQVILNLLNNSIDAIAPMKEKWIEMSLELKGKTLVIKMKDAGKGISKEVSQKMMNPFFTTKDPSKGTGLGLSISNNIISKNGGMLYYDETEPHTTFVVEYPLFIEDET